MAKDNEERGRRATLEARMIGYLTFIKERGSDAAFNSVTGQDLRDLRQAALDEDLVIQETVGLSLTEKGLWTLATAAQKKQR